MPARNIQYSTKVFLRARFLQTAVVRSPHSCACKGSFRHALSSCCNRNLALLRGEIILLWCHLSVDCDQLEVGVVALLFRWSWFGWRFKAAGAVLCQCDNFWWRRGVLYCRVCAGSFFPSSSRAFKSCSFLPLLPCFFLAGQNQSNPRLAPSSRVEKTLCIIMAIFNHFVCEVQSLSVGTPQFVPE